MAADPTPRQFVTAADVARTWPGLFPSVNRVYQLASSGVLPCLRLGRVVKFDLEAVERFLNGGGSALPGGWRREPEPAVPEVAEAAAEVVTKAARKPRRAAGAKR